MNVDPRSGPVGPDDEALLVRLGAVARTADPAPDLVRELGRAAFAMRRLDAELAELVADSAVDALAGVRATAVSGRLLTFESAGVTVEVEVSTAPSGGLTLVGQVVPAGDGGLVRLEARDGQSRSVELGEVGTFRFDAVAPGVVRLHVEHDPGTAVVTTSWVPL